MTRGQRVKKSESVHRTQVHVGPEHTRQGAVGKAMEGHAAQGGQVTLWGSDFDSKTSHLSGPFHSSRCDRTGVAGVLGGLT